MHPDRRPDDPGEAYAKDLEDRIVSEAHEESRTGRAPQGFHATPRLVVGLFIMTAGIMLALDNLGLVDSGVFFRFWPVVLILVGTLKLLAHEGQQKGGLFLVILGTCLLGFTLGYLNWARLWAVLFIVIGGNIVSRALRPPSTRPGQVSTSIDTLSLLSGSKTVSNSADFRGGQTLAIMGACEIDLRRATIAQGEAVLDVFAFWGGIEVRVPEEWEVVNRVNAFLGGSDNKTMVAPAAKQRLVVTGTVIMGGVEVKN